MDESKVWSDGERRWQKISYPELGIEINAALNMPDDTYIHNIRTNCARKLPQVWPHPSQDTEIAIVAGGWSLDESLDELRALQGRGVKTVALAGVGGYLLEQGIRPGNIVLLDARPGNKRFVIPGLGIKYFVASQVDPSVFDALQNEDVLIWHALNNPSECDAIKEHYESWVPVQGGNTIGLRTLRLMQILGFHRFHLFGYDSCNIPGKHHAYEQPAADDTEEAMIALNGTSFRCTAWQIQQAMEFMKMVKVFGQGWEIQVYGNGLIAHMIKEGGNG